MAYPIINKFYHPGDIWAVIEQATVCDPYHNIIMVASTINLLSDNIGVKK